MAQEGQEIAGYKLIQKIGEGGMGQVFLSEQPRLRRQVAIKLVRLDVQPDGGAEPADELTREAKALMALEHPHILPLYDAGRSGDTAYLVMPYLPEGSLQDALRPGPRQQLQLPLPPGDALLYVEQAASALQYAHDSHFIHRDVKPANFLIRSLSRSNRSGAHVKRLHLFLADFGLSKFLAYSSNTTHLIGTPAYMAPERFQGRATQASDQYSLAILFYYLLTGDLPYHGTPLELMLHHLNDTPPSPARLVGGLPESLASIIQRGMAKTSEERYPSVTSMAEAAREALEEAGMVPSQDSFPAIAAVRSDKRPRHGNPASERRRSRRGWMVALSALAALILIGAVLGGGVFLQIGPFPKNTPIVQATQAPTATQTPTPTPITPTPTSTAVPPASILSAILALKPFYTVDLTLGDGQWDGPDAINPNLYRELRTPPGAVNFVNAVITFNARTFPTPLAMEVDLTAASDQQFYLLLDTANGSSHLYYRLQLTNRTPPQAAHSSDNQHFTVDDTATQQNNSWADGHTHKLLFVLDGTRLLFYLDGKNLVDALTTAQPYATAKLYLASLDQASLTGIFAYRVPSGS